MDKEKEIYAKLPEGFQKLEPPLNEYLSFSKNADQEIAKLNRNVGPQLNYNPPGMGGAANNQIKQAKINQLIAQKSEFYARFDTQLQRAVNAVEKRKADQLKSTIDYHLSNNPYAGMNSGEKQKLKSGEKPQSTSFDFMEQRYFSKYESQAEMREPSDKLSFDDMSDIYLDRLDKDQPVHFDDLEPEKK